MVGCGKAGNPEADRALLKAALNENIEAVKQHLAAGADVNAKGDGRNTPLLYAARFGYKETAELLIANGADVNAKDVLGQTPLHFADTKEIAELLVAAGADVNAKTKRGETPLDLIEDDPEIRNLIRKHGGKMGAELKAEGN